MTICSLPEFHPSACYVTEQQGKMDDNQCPSELSFGALLTRKISENYLGLFVTLRIRPSLGGRRDRMENCLILWWS